MMGSNFIIEVDEDDNQIGTIEKLAAHEHGILHRAFSVFILNEKGEMLLQRRALGKYHSPGLWTNACCSHPAPGETTEEAANRRLQEELGFTTEVHHFGVLRYKEDVGGGLVENEYDHLYWSNYDGETKPNPEEVMEVCYEQLSTLQEKVAANNHEYTKWFILALPTFLAFWTGRGATARP